MDELSKVKETEEYEKVEHPVHYNSHPSGIECIEIVQHHNFPIGSAIKYLWRQGLKPGEHSVVDLEKAKKYIQFEIDRIMGDAYEPIQLAEFSNETSGLQTGDQSKVHGEGNQKSRC